MLELIPEIDATLRTGEPLTLATIVDHQGSTPRAAGASMIVRRNGTIAGTIGGGQVEHSVIQKALRLFESQGAILACYDLSQAGEMDLVCGGEMRVCIEHLAPNPENLAMLSRMHEEIKSGYACFWLGRIPTGNSCMQRTVRTKDGTWLGPLTVDPPLPDLLEKLTTGHNASAFLECAGERYLVTTIIPADTICLMGAGHVSKEIARLTRQVGFRTLVFDDRSEFANAGNFPEVEGVFVCNDFATVFDVFDIPAASYIVIVTRGHRHDRDVLAQALRSDATYIGMIGSRRKKEAVYQALVEKGFPQTTLARVHCPIGLSIGAETPAEIAVSVVAELIQHRAQRMRHD